MNRQLAAPQLIGSGGENPQVSALSRFHDDVWDFSRENQNPTTDKAMKRIRWAFATPEGDRFADPRFRRLRMAFKQFIYALCWHPIDSTPFGAGTLPSVFRNTKRFVVHLLGYPTPILRFKDVLPHHCEEYVEKLLSSDQCWLQVPLPQRPGEVGHLLPGDGGWSGHRPAERRAAR